MASYNVGNIWWVTECRYANQWWIVEFMYQTIHASATCHIVQYKIKFEIIRIILNEF